MFDETTLGNTFSVAWTFVTSAAVGLLVGLERERNPTAKAGLRTFALIVVLGTLSAMLARAADDGSMLALGMILVGATLTGAYLVDPRSATEDAGTTTVIAALVVGGASIRRVGAKIQIASTTQGR